MSEDFYEVLGVDRDASEKEIERAFRKLAAQHHPDVSDDPDAEERFKRIQKAKEVLTDEDKRAAYDRLGHDRFIQSEKHGGVDAGGAGPGGDPFGGDPFGGMGDIFEQFFGGGRGRNGPAQGRDLKTELEIDLEDAYRGATKQFTIARPVECGTCGGEGHPPGASVEQCQQCGGRGQVTQVQQSPFGRVQQTRTCPRCEGEGELTDETCQECRGDGVVREQSTLQVDIPAGIADGQTLRMEGEGAPGERGGPPGDLLIEVTVREHEDYERDGADLHYRLPISFPQAVFGDEVEVPTFDDPVSVDLSSGTQSGETITVRGKGMPRLRRRGDGNLIVHVQVVTPTSLSPEERDALEAFVEAGGEDIDVEQGLFERIRNSI